MRISDWSSDVCSSDLLFPDRRRGLTFAIGNHPACPGLLLQQRCKVARQIGQMRAFGLKHQFGWRIADDAHIVVQVMRQLVAARSEERRVAKECVSTCRSRGWRSH